MSKLNAVVAPSLRKGLFKALTETDIKITENGSSWLHTILDICCPIFNSLTPSLRFQASAPLWAVCDRKKPRETFVGTIKEWPEDWSTSQSWDIKLRLTGRNKRNFWFLFPIITEIYTNMWRFCLPSNSLSSTDRYLKWLSNNWCQPILIRTDIYMHRRTRRYLESRISWHKVIKCLAAHIQHRINTL